MTGQLLALLTAFCWAQNSVFYSIAGNRVSSRTVTHIRLWIAMPAVLIVHWFFFGSILPEVSLNTNTRLLLLSGFIGFFIADVFIFYSFVAIGPGMTLLILTLSPIISAVISFFLLAERLSPMQITGMLVTIGGILIVIYNENRLEKISARTTKGLAIAILGAVSQAAAMVMTKSGMSDGIHPVSANVLRIAAGFAGLIVFTAIRGEFVNDFRKMRDFRTLGLITTAALIGPVLGIILTLYALQLAPVGVVTTITQISPVILLPVEAVFFKRRITGWILAGTFTAVAGAALLFML